MATSAEKFIEDGKSFTENKLKSLSQKIEGLQSIKPIEKLCIYVTGSYGRLEASPFSDIDLFFVHDGSEKNNGIPYATKELLDKDIIRLIEEMGFPEFTNDAEHLTVHYIDDICQRLGSPDDDYKNFFTARLLLLLESRPVCHSNFYAEFVRKIIESYYRDYQDHKENFRPTFLINDIIRYWRTLCLNYEYKRNDPPMIEEENNKARLKRLKLKFSRLLTCFPAVLLLVSSQDVVTPDNLMKIVKMTPVERLDRASGSIAGAKEIVLRMKDQYCWFLEQTGRNREKVLEWISDRDHRKDAFKKGDRFGDAMFELLKIGTGKTDKLRYLVV